MILLSHPTGNEFARNAALALAEAGLLAEFDTCVTWDPRSRFNKLLPDSLRQTLARRSVPPEVLSRTKTFPLREIGRLLASRCGFAYPLRHERGFLSIDAVYRGLDRTVSRRLRKMPDVKGVYAYEDGALETFREARKRGIKCIYDLPIGYWRTAQAIYQEEAEREPEWAPTLSGLWDSQEKLARKDEELSLADAIIVPSSFTRESLALASGIKGIVKMIPFGGPAPSFGIGAKIRQKKLRLLYVGSLTQRKGLSYLFQAVDQLGECAELTVVGNKPLGQCRSLDVALARHHWIPSLPHYKILEVMRDHDVFVFPSLFEGFALVILEAMSQGLPVITTPNSGAADIVDDGVDGFIVPIRSSEAIADRLKTLLDRDRLAAMSDEALKKAAEYSWERYRYCVKMFIMEVLR